MRDPIFGGMQAIYATGLVIYAFAMKRKWKDEPYRLEFVAVFAVLIGCSGVYWLLPDRFHNDAVRVGMSLVNVATFALCGCHAWARRRSEGK